MTKPIPKKEVAIRFAEEIVRHIVFYASADAVEDFKEFGLLEQDERSYSLLVDSRFDFNEVKEYIENYAN